MQGREQNMNQKERQALKLDVEATILCKYSDYLHRKSQGYKRYSLDDTALYDRAKRLVIKKMYYYRKVLGLPFRQAVEYLVEWSGTSKAPDRKKVAYLDTMRQYPVYVQYMDRLAEKTLASALLDKCLYLSRMGVYRYAHRYSMGSTEFLEYLKRITAD